MKWLETINLAGSIASISGMSLLWLKTIAPKTSQKALILALPASILGALLPVCVITTAIEIVLMGARKWATNASEREKIIYWSLASAVALAFIWLLLVVIWGLIYTIWI